MTTATDDLDLLCVNTIRMLAADAVEKAKSGHPGMPMGAAPMAYVLWTRFLRHNPANPDWPNRDRFVLSAGHASMLLYALMHLTGYDLPLSEIEKFRQWDSRAAGHPEYGSPPGVETTTGPLGQGLANGVGMAIAERYLARLFNQEGFPIVQHYTYVLASDGDLMEGISSEAASLAGHLRLSRLIVLYDDNRVTIEGETKLAFTESVEHRFGAYGWHVQCVGDGRDLAAITEAIEEAREETARPSLIAVHTRIGEGAPNKQGKSSAHGEPLGPTEHKAAKENLGWPLEPWFLVPDPVRVHMREALDRGRKLETGWCERVAAWAASYPEPAGQWKALVERRLPPLAAAWERARASLPASGGIATREASGKVLNAIAPDLPQLIGGSADLGTSNKTILEKLGDFEANEPGGRNLRFGVREHAMGACLNGLALSGLIPYGGTFLVFSDYMRPPIRLAALMRQRVIYVYTHDSIGVGEDGPTHQPVEQLAALRVIPRLNVIRPADAAETLLAWRLAIERTDGPTALVLTRQKLPVLDRAVLAAAEGIEKGGYVLKDAKGGSGLPDAILLASGSEVHVALAAAKLLEGKGVAARVVNLASFWLFESQPREYRDSVLPAAVGARIAVEAASPFGWDRYVGPSGDFVTMNDFGHSAPAEVLFQKFGFTPENVAAKALALLGRG